MAVETLDDARIEVARAAACEIAAIIGMLGRESIHASDLVEFGRVLRVNLRRVNELSCAIISAVDDDLATTDELQRVVGLSEVAA